MKKNVAMVSFQKKKIYVVIRWGKNVWLMLFLKMNHFYADL